MLENNTSPRADAAATLVSPVQALSTAGAVGEVYKALEAVQPVSASEGKGGLGGVSAQLAGATGVVGLASKQGFKLGNIGLVIDYIQASELIDVPTVSFVPNAPDWFAGVMNLHGSVVPVIDLHNYLQLDDAEAAEDTKKQQMMLVLGHGEDAVGVYVDGLPDRVYLKSNEGDTDISLAPGRLRAYTQAIHQIDGEMWCSLDCELLLDDIELELQNRFE